MDFMDIQKCCLHRRKWRERRNERKKRNEGRNRKRKREDSKEHETLFYLFSPVFRSCNNKTQPFIILDIKQKKTQFKYINGCLFCIVKNSSCDPVQKHKFQYSWIDSL